MDQNKPPRPGKLPRFRSNRILNLGLGSLLIFAPLVCPGPGTHTGPQSPAQPAEEQVLVQLRALVRWQEDYLGDFPGAVYYLSGIHLDREFSTADEVQAQLARLDQPEATAVWSDVTTDLQAAQSSGIRSVVFHEELPECQGSDLTACVGRKERILDPNRNDAAALVEYPWVKERFGQVREFTAPEGLEQFANDGLKDVVNALPPSCQARVRPYRIAVREPQTQRGLLHLEVDRPNQTIVVSPLLVRTIFLYVADQSHSMPFRRLLQMYGNRERTLDDLRDVVGNYAGEFRSEMAFPLARELAQIYSTCRTEEQCDLLAIQNVRALNGPRLGAFEHLFASAIQQGRSDLWGDDALPFGDTGLQGLVGRLKTQLNGGGSETPVACEE
jgi:hypothetical protein